MLLCSFINSEERLPITLLIWSNSLKIPKNPSPPRFFTIWFSGSDSWCLGEGTGDGGSAYLSWLQTLFILHKQSYLKTFLISKDYLFLIELHFLNSDFHQLNKIITIKK